MATYRRGWNDGKKPDKKRPTVTEFGLSNGILWICYCRRMLLYLMGSPSLLPNKIFDKDISEIEVMLASDHTVSSKS